MLPWASGCHGLLPFPNPISPQSPIPYASSSMLAKHGASDELRFCCSLAKMQYGSMLAIAIVARYASVHSRLQSYRYRAFVPFVLMTLFKKS